MAFLRARTDEQRAARREQILRTAAGMLVEMPVAKLSLNELSRRTCLAKANVLRYFESREAILLDLLHAEMREWIAELDGVEPAGVTPRERGDRLAEILARSLEGRPVLCDLLSAQPSVLEHNISAELALEHKREASHLMESLSALVGRHLPELGADDATALVETTLLVAVAAWPCSRPPEAMLAAYAADPALAPMRPDFGGMLRRTVAVTVCGLLARK